jgi:hypothetical protein
MGGAAPRPLASLGAPPGLGTSDCSTMATGGCAFEDDAARLAGRERRVWLLVLGTLGFAVFCELLGFLGFVGLLALLGAALATLGTGPLVALHFRGNDGRNMAMEKQTESAENVWNLRDCRGEKHRSAGTRTRAASDGRGCLRSNHPRTSLEDKQKRRAPWNERRASQTLPANRKGSRCL